MIDIEKSKEHDHTYMSDLRRELVRVGVTEKRLRKLDGLPLTATQVAYAIRSYVVKIESKRRANTRIKRTRARSA